MPTQETASSAAEQQLARAVEDLDSDNPCKRLAALVADAELRPSLTEGQLQDILAQIHGTADQIIDQQPYLRRDLQEFCDECLHRIGEFAQFSRVCSGVNEVNEVLVLIAETYPRFAQNSQSALTPERT